MPDASTPSPHRWHPAVPLTTALVALLVLVLAPTPAAAQGFGVYEQGACSMGRAETGVAAPCDDGSALFFNPAGIVGQPGITISAGATAVIVSGDFTADRTGATTDLDNDPIIVPHLFLTYGINDSWAAGLGVYVPYGLGTQWPQSFEGAFLGYDNSLQSIYVQPTLAYQVTDRLAVGAGFDVVFGHVELNQLADLSTVEAQPGVTFGNLGIPFHTAFADTKLEGNGIGIGANLGARFAATDWLDLGVRFLTPITVTYEGTATFEQVATGLVLAEGNVLSPFDEDQDGNPDAISIDDLLVLNNTFSTGPLVEQDIETEITLPAMFVAGAKVQATPALALYFDYQWTGWSSFDVIELDFENDALDTEQVENYENTSAFRVGADLALTEALTLRAGYLYNQTAAPVETVTPLLPESNRNHLTLGLGWMITPQIEVNAAYQYLNQNDRRGRIRELEEGETGDDANSGLYSFGGHLVGTTLTLHF